MSFRVVTFLGLGPLPKAPYYHDVAWRMDGEERGRSPLVTAAEVRSAPPGTSLFVLGTPEVKARWFAPDDELFLRLLELEGVRPEVIGFVEIPRGHDEAEMWRLFQAVVEAIAPRALTARLPSGRTATEPDVPEEVWLDITHGFRIQPFLAASAIAYARAQALRDGGELKIRVLYGELEDNSVGTVREVTALLDALDWNTAIDDLLRSGSGTRLHQLLLSGDKQVRAREAKAGVRQPAGRPAWRELGNAIHELSDDLAAVRVPATLTRSAPKVADALAKVGTDPSLPPPVRDQVAQLGRWVAKIRAARAVSQPGVEAAMALAHLYESFGRTPEALATAREALVTAEQLARFGTSAIQPGVCSAAGTIGDQRHQVESTLGAGTTERSRAFLAIAQLRNDVLHAGFKRQPLEGSTLRKNVSAAIKRAQLAAGDAVAPEPIRTGFLNVSNHPSDAWATAQREAAEALGGAVTDLPFPDVAPELEDVDDIARSLVHDILARSPAFVHLAGEAAVVASVLHDLARANVPCVVATTTREVAVSSDGAVAQKTSMFRFVRWRVMKPGGAR